MVDPALLLVFIGAVTLLMLIPGPNVALIVVNSSTHGVRAGLMTVAGTVAAQAISLALVSAGLTTLLEFLGLWFGWLRWLGATYLIWLGIRQWRAPPDDLARVKPQARVFVQAFLVSLANPKTLIFYGAFFPQFIVPTGNVGAQAALLSVVFLVIALVIDSGWSLVAARVRPLLMGQAKLRNRVGGGILAGAGAAMALFQAR